MVPRLSISSCRVMPMPSSAISKRAGLLVGDDADFGLGRGRKLGLGQRLEPAAVDGVGGVGDQFPQKNFALGVQRVDDEVQKPPDLGAECVSLCLGDRPRICHAEPPSRAAICARRRHVSMPRGLPPPVAAGRWLTET